jgi:hypothetical protein
MIKMLHEAHSRALISQQNGEITSFDESGNGKWNAA